MDGSSLVVSNCSCFLETNNCGLSLAMRLWWLLMRLNDHLEAVVHSLTAKLVCYVILATEAEVE